VSDAKPTGSTKAIHYSHSTPIGVEVSDAKPTGSTKAIHIQPLSGLTRFDILCSLYIFHFSFLIRIATLTVQREPVTIGATAVFSNVEP
jgi:hypothetical protein